MEISEEETSPVSVAARTPFSELVANNAPSILPAEMHILRTADPLDDLKQKRVPSMDKPLQRTHKNLEYSTRLQASATQMSRSRKVQPQVTWFNIFLVDHVLDVLHYHQRSRVLILKRANTNASFSLT